MYLKYSLQSDIQKKDADVIPIFKAIAFQLMVVDPRVNHMYMFVIHVAPRWNTAPKARKEKKRKKSISFFWFLKNTFM